MNDAQGLVAQVISLTRRTDRRMQFGAHAINQGIPYTFVDADATQPAFTACTRSHKSVIMAAMQRQAPYVLVMEDDCWFPAEDGFWWFLQNWPTGPFDLYLGGIYGGQQNQDGTWHRFSGTHCYVAAARFFPTFLSIAEDNNVDYALTGLGVYRVCQPYAAIQRDGYSDNAGKHTEYGHYVAGKYRI